MINNELKIIRPLSSVIFLGKTGSGKTSLINTLFGFNLPIDNVEACTKELNQICIISNNNRPTTHPNIMIIDTPGFAESKETTNQYLELYKNIIPNVSQIIWVLQADLRVYRPDQETLKFLVPFFPRKLNFKLVLNRIDDIGPGNWDNQLNQPSSEQFRSIEEKIEDIFIKFSKFFYFKKSKIIICSTKKNYGIKNLFEKINLGD